ncbi:MAG: glycosyltransferase family 2 protein [Fusobacterium mortiferum]|nr:glycosyltransferase family 2 protein [Fusobacterium mortiferum]MDY4801101.1 glycosyltransferase family 2 protein [Fusobacterium mortiferum]MDY5980577.1 glycosyltransferase family 2 protein [Fusobacterium mortiferum]
MKEKVSIIVPIYNVVQYLEKCINSICNQTYKNIEIIMVDDCSTDGSRELAKELSKKDNRITFVQRSKNGGLSAARNTGMKIATGYWITFVDSDDWLENNCIEELYQTAKKDNADIVVGGVYYSYKDKKPIEKDFFYNLKTSSSQQKKVALLKPYACGKLYRLELIKKLKIDFPEEIKRAEDLSTVVPWMTYTDKISIVNKPLYYYFQRENSLSNSNDIDVSFYPKTLERMKKLSNPIFKEEIEYRIITETLYGMIVVMIKANKSNEEILKVINNFKFKCLNWKSNKYLKVLNIKKRIFIELISRNYLKIVRLIILLNNILGEK